MKQLLLPSFIILASCSSQTDSKPPAEIRTDFYTNNEQFSNYWYSGKAELASYDLEQMRYGELRKGSAVLIFVTEPFSPSVQVKLDDPETEGAATVMKMNSVRKFITGIYPYSIMLSVFTPVDDYHFPNTLKTTTSVQEWCGHTFAQLNFNKSNYKLKGYSYFETEADIEKEINGTILEDELWNRIRLNPDKLPIGRIEIIPTSLTSRLSHTPFEVLFAETYLLVGEIESEYHLKFLEDERELQITFETDFPFKILSWKEIQGGELLSSAKLKNTLHIDYWRKNAKTFEYLRDSLGL